MANNYSFEDIVDLIGGPVESWPCSILARYRKLTYNSSDRFALCLFNFTNGFDNRLFLQFASARGKLRDRGAAQHIINLTNILEMRKQNLDTWYSFNLIENRWTYLNGNTKYY